MKKQIFSEENRTPEEPLQPKYEFTEAETVIEADMGETTEAELILDQNLKPSRLWVRLLIGALILFGFATFAQSIQWLIDTYQAKQWIYFAFAIAFFAVSLAGIGAIIAEWRKLIWLRKYHQHQQQSQQLLIDAPHTSGEIAITFCKSTLANMPQTAQLAESEKRWLNQLDEAYNSQEVLYLFSENVLQPIDKKVKRLISQSATENAIIVAVSPLAIVDILMMAWRNIHLINKITKAYGMELGYFSRLRLFRIVLTNMVFAGATEVATDMGVDVFSQSLTAKLSMRMAQGIGAGLLTARLGIKAMEFCRPIAFRGDERPKLSVVRQELLGVLKEKVFSKSLEKAHHTA